MKYRFIVGIGLLIVLFIIIASCFSKPGTISLEDQNIDIVRLAFYAYNDGDWTSMADLYSPGYIQHLPGGVDPLTWTEYELVCRIVHSGIPDLKLRIIDIFADKDKVAVRSIWEYRSDSRLFKRYYPKGVAQGSGIDIYRIKNSKIVEEWCESDPALIEEFCSIYKRLQPKK